MRSVLWRKESCFLLLGAWVKAEKSPQIHACFLSTFWKRESSVDAEMNKMRGEVYILSLKLPKRRKYAEGIPGIRQEAEKLGLST
jgi:uncharacterized protein YihD (DUF1040 family)